jgi:hypothetical protein
VSVPFSQLATAGKKEPTPILAGNDRQRFSFGKGRLFWQDGQLARIEIDGEM